MPALTLTQAITATGKSRSTLIRAIRTGKVSASRDEAGAYQVTPDELHRVFPVAEASTPLDQVNDVSRYAEVAARFEAEQAKVAMLQDQVTDLRRRLDAEAEERRKLTALLTDQRAGAAPAAPVVEPVRRGWWRRLTGG